MKKRTHSCVDGFVQFREGSEAYNYGTKSKKTRSLGLILSCMSKRTVFVPSQKQWRTFNEYSALYSHKFSFIPLPKAFFLWPNCCQQQMQGQRPSGPRWSTEQALGRMPQAMGPPRGVACGVAHGLWPHVQAFKEVLQAIYLRVSHWRTGGFLIFASEPRWQVVLEVTKRNILIIIIQDKNKKGIKATIWFLKCWVLKIIIQ